MPRRFSLIGTGFGATHAQYLKRLGWELDTVYCRERIDKARTVCESLGGRAVRLVDELHASSDNAELIVVSSFPEGRIDLLRRIDAPGRILLVDKPFCGHDAGLASFLQESQGQVRAFFQWRYQPQIASLREQLGSASGLSMDISFEHDFLSTTNHDFFWRHQRAHAVGGAIADLGVHCIDLAHFLLGQLSFSRSRLDIVHPVRSSAGRSVIAETDDAGSLALIATGRGSARIAFSRVAQRRRLSLRVAGAFEAALDIDPDCWWVDPAGLSAGDWRLQAYEDLIGSGQRVLPSAEAIMNVHSVFLQALQGQGVSCV